LARLQLVTDIGY